MYKEQSTFVTIQDICRTTLAVTMTVTGRVTSIKN